MINLEAYRCVMHDIEIISIQYTVLVFETHTYLREGLKILSMNSKNQILLVYYISCYRILNTCNKNHLKHTDNID